MTLEEMKKKKTELGLTSEMISQLSGVPLGTVQKIFAGTTKAPRRLTIEALEKVLDRSDEASQAFPAAQGRRYTLDDYYALPDEQRVELIDGVFYDIAAPSYLHQAILIQLLRLFSDCAEQHDMPCEVFIAPCDVRLDRDNYTMVQPDLLVICGKLDYLHMKRLEGAPDLAVEILSPSTRSKDMILKLYKYEMESILNAGWSTISENDKYFDKAAVIYDYATGKIAYTFPCIVLSEDKKSYICERNEEFHTAKDDSDLASSFKSAFSISLKWAAQLIEDGYLEEVVESTVPNNKEFVNVFDEIDSLLNRYQQELDFLPKEMKDSPECLKVEKTAVLSNMIKLLTHLKSLRK